MTAASMDRIRPLLACPGCHDALTQDWRCAGCGVAYQEISGMPILVDFEKSILDEKNVLGTEAGSPVDRRQTIVDSSAELRRKPYLKTVYENIEAFRQELPPQALVLIVGGGVADHGTAVLYTDPGLEVVAFDIYASPLTHFVADAHHIPLAPETIDGVIIQAVLEHVLDPNIVVAEIHRVLKQSGLVYAETPFLQNVHEGPYDFTRYTESGHRWLFRRFELMKSGPIGGPGLQLIWSLDYLIRGLTGKRRLGLRARRGLTFLARLDRRMKPGQAIDSASAVFFLGRKTDVALRPSDMVRHYKGAQ